jgi:citrate lyase beta subunit
MKPPQKPKPEKSIFVNLRLTPSLLAKLDALQAQERVVDGVPLPKMKRSALIRWLVEVGMKRVQE